MVPDEEKRTRVTVLVPAYNEQETIRQSIQGVIDADFGEAQCEIIVVDDCSTDRTAEIAESMHAPGLNVIRMAKNGGKGRAIRIGLEAATGSVVVIHDADLEYDAKDLPNVVRPVLAGDSVAAFGTRFAGHSRPAGMKLQNLIANRTLAAAANILFGGNLTDEATCYKAIRTDVLRSMNLRSERFEFCPEVTAKLLRAGHKIVEVPVWYKARTVAEGKKIHWYDGLEAIWTLIKFRFVK